MAENTLIITGRLGEKPEMKDNGRGPWVRATLAHSQGHYDKQARQWVPAATDTAWFTLTANGKTGDQLAAMHKGDMIMVAGAFSVDIWTPQTGNEGAFYKRTDLRIRVSSVALVPRTQAGQTAAPAAGYAPAPAPQQPAAMPAAEPWENYTEPEF